MTIHYVNLSNGLQCPDAPSDAHIMRVESTACEQKLWDKVAWQVAASGLLYHHAIGQPVLIHDYSERERVTRALWQGVEMMLWIARQQWGIYEPTCRIWPRGGGRAENVTRHATEINNSLDSTVRKQLAYYGKYVSPAVPLGAFAPTYFCRRRLAFSDEVAA